MSKIELLPEHIIDQIKAGEVIERPSTLIKELLENSIDAKSTKIKIHIINSGLDLISIEDNGHGMTYEDLPLAFSRHATSKIEDFEDIYKLSTYGFRGEALASISSVSKVTCNSNKRNDKRSTIKFDGAQQIVHQEEEKRFTTSGTSIFIKDLFFNTPVRMKFIQSKTTEKNQLKRIINSFILTHPNVEFDTKWDDESKVRYHSVEESLISKRVKDLFEKRTNPLSLIETSSAYDGFKVKVILSKNSQKGHAGKFHYLFINKRYIQDISIHKIILNSAKDLWQNGETGNYCVFIDAPADQIDVNVHPNKTVVKIFQSPKLYSLISSTIKELISIETVKSPIDQRVQQTSFSQEDKDQKINYKAQSFDQDFSIQDYFDVLDNKQESNQAENKNNILHSSDLFTLYKHKEEVFLLKNTSFLICSIESLLTKSKIEASPLLVSEPFKIKLSSKEQEILDLVSIGFEMDRLDDETLVLRTFPTCLDNFPYLEFLKTKLNNILGKKIYNIKIRPKNYQIESLLEKQGLTYFLEKQVIKILTDKDFKDLFK